MRSHAPTDPPSATWLAATSPPTATSRCTSSHSRQHGAPVCLVLLSMTACRAGAAAVVARALKYSPTSNTMAAFTTGDFAVVRWSRCRRPPMPRRAAHSTCRRAVKRHCRRSCGRRRTSPSRSPRWRRAGRTQARHAASHLRSDAPAAPGTDAERRHETTDGASLRALRRV